MCVVRTHYYAVDPAGNDTWRWDTAEQMEAALATMPTPEARAADALTRGATATDAEVAGGR
jgi:hypothetical protein